MRNYSKIIIPKGIRYISEWEDYGFHLTQGPCIIDKKIPGCGFTEYYLRCDHPALIVSPRIMLIENKEIQGQGRYFYAKSSYDEDPQFDKDLEGESRRRKSGIVKKFGRGATKEDDAKTLNLMKGGVNSDSIEKAKKAKEQMRNDLLVYLNHMRDTGKYPKILVTYDSFGFVRDLLDDLGLFDDFLVMIDEFQSVLHDSRFKAEVELEFMQRVNGLSNVHLVSATPMLQKYLDMLPDFNNLNYYELDWVTEDPDRLIRPNLTVKSMYSVSSEIKSIVSDYLNNNFPITTLKNERGEIYKYPSTEAVFYVNSVNHIIKCINSCGLRPDQVNILCSKTPKNEKRIRQKLGRKFSIGSIPLKGEDHKMFTFCTRTVYLGADFYSKCASSYIFSDSNLDFLSIDISQDLPQILGRQRLIENPWKNAATFYYKTTLDYLKATREELQEHLDWKIDKTNAIISLFNAAESDAGKVAIYNLVNTSTERCYLGLNKGKVIFNEYIHTADVRAFDIQQIDYADRFSVFNELDKISDASYLLGEVSSRLKHILSLGRLSDRLKYVCELSVSDRDLADAVVSQLSPSDKIRYFYQGLGPDRCRANKYKIYLLSNELDSTVGIGSDTLRSDVLNKFIVGNTYTLTEVKEVLGSLLESYGIDLSPKTSMLSRWFDVTKTKATDSLTGNRINAVRILSIKGPTCSLSPEN